MTSISILPTQPVRRRKRVENHRRAADVVRGVRALFQPRRRLSLDLLVW